MTSLQQQVVRNIINTYHVATGINFNEVPNGQPVGNGLVFVDNSALPYSSGATDESKISSASTVPGFITNISRSDMISYNGTGNPDFGDVNGGSKGYTALMKQVGTALGLNYQPYEGDNGGNPSNIPAVVNNVNASIVSAADHNVQSNTWPTALGTEDVAALNWLYGGDGLGGQYGLTLNSSGNPTAGGFNPSMASSAPGQTPNTTQTNYAAQGLLASS